MNIPVKNVIVKIEQQLNEMKSEVEKGNQRRVQEAASMIKAYCELLTENEGVSMEKPQVPAQDKRIIPSSNVTTSSSFHASKEEGSLLDF